jgi:uncharacterized protein YukE
LTTETYTIDETIGELDERIDELNAQLEDLDESTDDYEAVQQRRDRLSYFRTGLQWQRDEEDWGDAEIELGALNTGEKAMMHRKAPDSAGPEEMRVWFVAASTENAPYAGDGLKATFQGLSNCHPGFTDYLEAKANSLGVPASSGNRSSTSSKASKASETSSATSERDSTTSSSSDSPTA